MLSVIESRIHGMTRAEKKVADVVLSGPYKILRKPIAQLALEAGVSEPTVIRFCRSFGCNGFQDFKIQLANSLATNAHFASEQPSINETVPDIITKVIDGSIASLIKVRNALPPDLVEAAIKLLSGADRIEFYGSGGSGIVAQDAQHKFFRLGVPVNAYSDPTVHSVSAGLLKPGSVIVAISQSGNTDDILASVQRGLAAGAEVLAITADNSPLAKLSSICLPMNVLRDEDFYAPIKSRMAHLAIIDVLAVGVALSRGPEFQKTLRSI